MAARATLTGRTISIEIENGTNSKGEKVYAKKNISNINTELTTEQIYTTATKFAAMLSATSRYLYQVDTSRLENN